MSHYQKIACTGVRLVAFTLFVWGIISFMYWALGSISPNNPPDETLSGGIVFWSGVIYTFAGIVVFLLSKAAGKMIGRGMDD
jgi:hypothetical protein